MKRFVCAALAALLISPPATAATYHVREGGNNNNAGTSYATAWATIAKSDAAARPGDIVYVYAKQSQWDRFPRPDSAGSNPTGGGYITYIGATVSPMGDALADSVVRRNIVLPAMSWTNQKYTTVKGFYVQGDASSDTLSARDSLVTLDFSGGCYWSGSYGTFSGSTFGGTKSLINGPPPPETKTCDVTACANNGTPCPDCGIQVNLFDFTFAKYRPSKVNHFIDCKWTNLTTSSQPHALQFAMNDSLLLKRCRLSFKVIPTASDAHNWKFWYTRRSLIEDCYAEYDSRANNHETGWGALIQRNHSGYNTFNRDTFVTAPTSVSQAIVAFSTSGNYPGSVVATTVDSCFFWLKNGWVWFQDNADSVTFTNNVVVGGGATALACEARMNGPNLFQQNTFVGRGYGWSQVVQFGDPFTRDTTKFYSNLVYSDANEQTISQPGGSGIPAGGVLIADAAGTFKQLYKGNWNAYRFLPYTWSRYDRSIMWHDGDWGFDKPGNGTSWEAEFSAPRKGDADSLSIAVYDTVFTDPNISATPWAFNPAPPPTSRLLGAGIDGTDIGAIQSSTQPQFEMLPKSYNLQLASGQSDTAFVTFYNTNGTADLNVTMTFSSTEMSTDSLSFAIAPGNYSTRNIIITATTNTYRQMYATVEHDAPTATSPQYFTIYVGYSGGGNDVDDGLRLP